MQLRDGCDLSLLGRRCSSDRLRTTAHQPTAAAAAAAVAAAAAAAARTKGVGFSFAVGQRLVDAMAGCDVTLTIAGFWATDS